MRILIAGGGQVGALIAGRLTREGNEVVIVEKDEERCSQLEEALDAKVVQGSGASVLTLRQAGLGSAEMLIAVTSSDEINVLACLIVQAESSVRVKVARVRTHEVEHWRRVTAQAGLDIDLIIHPETDITERIMRVVRVPGVSDILDFAGGEVKLFGMNVEADSWVAGKTLEELDRAGPPQGLPHRDDLPGPTGHHSPWCGSPSPGRSHLHRGTTAANLDHVMLFMGLTVEKSFDRVMIIGGKQAGIWVAETLEKQGVNVRLIEREIHRCKKISGILSKTIVVHGDGTDQATLEEENVEGVDAFLALTNDDEDNIIASLLARRLGAKKVVALINRLNYLPMVQRLGINTSVSPRLATVDRILQFVRKGHVLSVTTFGVEEAEAIELIATEGSKYVGPETL